MLSQDLLGLMGLSVGDEVEVDLVDRTLTVRPVNEVERDAIVSRAIDDVMARRRGMFERLAAGVDDPASKPKKRK